MNGKVLYYLKFALFSRFVRTVATVASSRPANPYCGVAAPTKAARGMDIARGRSEVLMMVVVVVKVVKVSGKKPRWRTVAGCTQYDDGSRTMPSTTKANRQRCGPETRRVRKE
jgi:uncharacterized ParB-like nuclease family protein